MRDAWIAVASCFLLSSCSCGGGGIAVDDFPTQAAKTVCTKVYGCCTAAEVMPSNFGPDQPACETTVRKSVYDVNAVKRSESQGRAAFRSDRASDCLTQYEALSCDQLKSNSSSTLAPCDTVVEAKVAVGSACGQDRECIGSTCEGEGIGVDGVCRAFLTENSSCADGGTCGSGLYCFAGMCRRTLADGTSCNGNYECTTGGCNGKDDAGNPGTCGLKGGAGTMCYATTGCSASGGSAPFWLAFGALGLGVLSLMRRSGRKTES